MTLLLRALPWSVMAARRDWDPQAALDLASACIAAESPKESWALADALDRALVARFGAWAAGWRWSVHDGGPIRAYCCAKHSLHRGGDEARRTSALAVRDALLEWRQFLEDVEALFEELATLGDGLPLEEAVERAAAQLLLLAIERTGLNDAWYGTFELLSVWYLEATGHDRDVTRPVVRAVIAGSFASWVEPSTSDAREACATLGLEMALAMERAPIDALAEWKKTRGRAFVATSTRSPEVVKVDGHRAFIERIDRPRDAARADRMHEALSACRASAVAGEALTLPRLASWQAIVLGEEAPLRQGDAFAKGGRERYGLDASTVADLTRALAQAEGDELPSVRAARAYLDVAFFHPFRDGNARSARLALDHVLTRAGLALHAAEPLFVVSRGASDAEGASAFASLVGYLTGPLLR